jgi:hypothetical protein
MARRLTTLLPAMTLAEALEITRTQNVAGLNGGRTALATTRRARSSLWSSIVMHTGNGRCDFAIRGWHGDDCAGLSAGNDTPAFCTGQGGSSCSGRLYPCGQRHELGEINDMRVIVLQ